KICALLGCNGCGKTTLSRLILGILKPSAGTVTVFGRRPGSQLSGIPGPRVGYMPQDIALYPDLTVAEALRYYAMIYSMGAKLTADRIHEFRELLDLPEDHHFVGQLSGGQQRLVSMAVTMIHKPRLLVLDEPTVGLDSILRARIWEYLENQCKLNELSVMITTHYIEEATSAATVSFIYNGRCLAQSSPQQLISQYQCHKLEEVYLQLCIQSNKDIKEHSYAGPSAHPTQTSDDNTSAEIMTDKMRPKYEFRVNRVKTLVWKNWLRLQQNPSALFMYHLFPLLLIYGLHVCFGSPRRIPIAIHTAADEWAADPLSTRFTAAIDDRLFNYTIHATNESAVRSVSDGHSVLSVTFARNFTDSFRTRLLYPIDATDEELADSQILVYADMSDIQGYYAQYYLWQTFNRFLAGVAPETQYNPRALSLPIDVYTEEDTDYSFSNLFIPGFLVSCVYTVTVTLSALFSINDRSRGQKERDLVAGVTALEMMFTHHVIITINVLIQTSLVIVFAFYILEYRLLGSVADVYGLLVSVALEGMALGSFISLLFKDDVMATAIATYISTPLYVVSGVFWPIESMPILFQSVVKWWPITGPIISMRSVLFRGWTVLSYEVLFGYAICWLYAIVFTIFNIFLSINT
ncbi:unnamed protein product, partial [Medioppia subpectinata]